MSDEERRLWQLLVDQLLKRVRVLSETACPSCGKRERNAMDEAERLMARIARQNPTRRGEIQTRLTGATLEGGPAPA